MSAEIILAFVSGGLMILGVFFWKKSDYLVKHGRKAEARIFKNNFRRMTTSSEGGVYFPVVRFLTDKKEWITQELDIGYNPPKGEGEIVEILYDPDDPTYIQLNTMFILIFLPRIMIPVGLIGFVLSLLIYLEVVNIT
ncbi:MAG: DUF3592 domain-containing protein [Ekhidna sp.]